MGRAYDSAQHRMAFARLHTRERHLLGARPGATGVAVSGGGIRSATFALGVFQAWAETGQLPHIDYLSTVSGGGYFGAFLGRLFARFDGGSDGTVGLEETRLPGVADHCIVHCSHTGLVFSADAVAQAAHFLRHGRFEHAAEPPAV